MKLISQPIAVMEIVGVEWRSIISVLFHVPFLIGHVMNPLISYLTLTWSGFQMAVSIPSIFLLTYYWYVHINYVRCYKSEIKPRVSTMLEIGPSRKEINHISQIDRIVQM